jgi:hypothetical protein
VSRLAQIEAALQASWDRETLEVYADALQASEDPRGSLIAFALASRPLSPEHVRERDQLLEEWLGGFRHEGRSWIFARSGFVSAHFWELASVTSFLASHLAPFLLRVSVNLDPAECSTALDALASRSHPWCIELGIKFWGLPRDAVPISPEIIERVAEAMPRVTTLHVRGQRVLHTPIPPQIEKLELEHPRGLIGRLPMPEVAELVLPFVYLRGPGREVSDLLHPHTFPGLCRLDLEQNEGHLSDVLAVLEHVEAIDRLSWLRLPSLRGEGDVRRVRDLLERAPDLVIDIARSHRPLRHLVPIDEPRIRVPDPVPCAPADTMTEPETLLVAIPGWDRAFRFHVGALASNTEYCYAAFSSEQQAALTALWERIPALGAAPIGFPAAAMARVVETMMLTDLDAQVGIEPWQELEDVLREGPCAVMISRPG